jgi:hypothetical protein
VARDSHRPASHALCSSNGLNGARALSIYEREYELIRRFGRRTATDLEREPPLRLVGRDALTEPRVHRDELANSLVGAWNASGVRTLERHAADLRAIVERERGQFRASNRTIEHAITTFPELSFLALIRGNGLARIGEYEGARRAYEAFHPLGSPPDSAFRGGDARTFAWHDALLADAFADHADVATLSALADSIERIGARSCYGRDWLLHHHVRGLIAVRTGDLPRAEREFQKSRWVNAGGWTRTVLELAKVQLARTTRARRGLTPILR